MSNYKQTDWANQSTHGGKRAGAGRKPSGKQTAVIRIDAELLPAIEQLKQGLNIVTDNQDKEEIERLKEIGLLRVEERDRARLEAIKLKSELDSAKREPTALNAEIERLKRELNKHKTQTCQCLTGKGVQCSKTATHENKLNGFVVWLCEQHYKALT